MSASREPAAFLDRDGTIIEDTGYPREPDRVRVLAGAAEGLTRLAAAGLRLVVVSNQSGIGRGIVTPEQAEAVHQRFVEELRSLGVTLDGARYCPHAPGSGCDCRKPQPGMLRAAAGELGLELGMSFMIGDKESDIEAGRLAGCRTVLLNGSVGGSGGADHIASGWGDAVDYVLASVSA